MECAVAPTISTESSTKQDRARGWIVSRVTSTLQNGGLLKLLLTVLTLMFGVIVAMLGFWISQQTAAIDDARTRQDDNGYRITAIETRLGRIETDIRELRE